MEHKPLLWVRELSVTFPTARGELWAVDGLSCQMEAGEMVGLVGESGAGKTVFAQALLGLVRPPGRLAGGRVFFEGEDVLAKNRRQLEAFRGGKAAMIFQNPSACLNPAFSIGSQLTETIRLRSPGLSRRQARGRALELLDMVGLGEGEALLGRYPHQLSGGMCQRVMIALALAGAPRLLLADEPTASLDPEAGGQILSLLKDLQIRMGLSVLLITHQLTKLESLCDRVWVMYGGRVVEAGRTAQLFRQPSHPYTMGLLQVAQWTSQEPGKLLPQLPGEPGNLPDRWQGCPFAPRCEQVMKVCLTRRPPEIEVEEGQLCACWLGVREELTASRLR